MPRSPPLRSLAESVLLPANIVERLDRLTLDPYIMIVEMRLTCGPVALNCSKDRYSGTSIFTSSFLGVHVSSM